VEISRQDAARLGAQQGDMRHPTSRRGVLEAPARIAEIHAGHLFVPFHYGDWDDPGHARAANELTLFSWDPVGKQPHYTFAAVKLEKVAAPRSAQPEDMDATRNRQGVLQAVGSAATSAYKAAEKVVAPPRAHIADYLGLLQESERILAGAFDQVKANHPKVPDIAFERSLLGDWSRQVAGKLQPLLDRYGTKQDGEPRKLEDVLVKRHLTSTGFKLVRDLHDLFLLANESLVSIAILHQAALGLRDEELKARLEEMREKNARHRRWLDTRAKRAAPRALVVPS
jgi:hypothetical protein